MEDEKTFFKLAILTGIVFLSAQLFLAILKELVAEEVDNQLYRSAGTEEHVAGTARKVTANTKRVVDES